MKLLFVARRFPPDVRSGTETVFENLVAEARRAGHDVHLVCGFRHDRSGVPADATAVDLRGRTTSAWGRMAHAAIMAARRVGPEVVLSNSIEVVVPGVPTVTIVHDVNFGGAGTGGASAARRTFYRAQSLALARVVAVSDVTRAALVRLGVPAAKVVTIHNGVALDHFRPAPRTPDDQVRFVHVSRIMPGKGQHCALDALGRMRPDQRKHFRLDIVGTVVDKLYADQLRLQAWNLPVGFHFDVPDVLPWYQSADVALFPTRMPEGFGYGAIEAMAVGLPVVNFDDDAVREASGGHTVTVPREDVVGLRDAMLRLAADPAERARRSAEGREWVARYRWDTTWRTYERLLESVRR